LVDQRVRKTTCLFRFALLCDLYISRQLLN